MDFSTTTIIIIVIVIIMAVFTFMSYNKSKHLATDNVDLNNRLVQTNIRLAALETAYTRAVKGFQQLHTPIKKGNTSVMNQSYQTEEVPAVKEKDRRSDLSSNSIRYEDTKKEKKKTANVFSLDDLDNIPAKPEIGAKGA